MTEKDIRMSVYDGWVSGIRQREEILGVDRLPDGPTSECLASLMADIESVVFGESSAISAGHASELTRSIEIVVDSWLYPERDPVGTQVVDYLIPLHQSLCESIAEAVPEVRELQQKADDLRLVARMANRAVLEEELRSRQPSLLKRVIAKIFR